MRAPLLAFGIGTILGAQTLPTIRVTTRLVEVNVIVRDKRGPVTGLTREDFTLTDNGKPREIAFFAMHSAKGSAPPPPETPPTPANVFTNDPERHGARPTSATVVLLDGVNTSIVDQFYAKREFVEFLKRIEPQDRIAVYTMGRTLQVLSDFTSDPRRLAAIVSRHIGRVDASPDISRLDPIETGDAKTDRIWNEFLRRDEERELERRVNLTVEAIEAVAGQIGRIPGRKNLVWVTASFPFAIMSKENPRIFAREVNRAARALNAANIAIYPVDARGLVGIPGLSAASQRPPAGGPSVANPAGQDTMNIIAGATGGRAFKNSNDIRGAIRSVMDDSEVTYTLAFQPDPDGLDSTFHRIRVKVNRPGVDVRHREGYTAVPDPPAGDEQAQAIRTALVSPLEAAGIRFRVEVGRQDPLWLTVSIPAEEVAGPMALEAVFAQRAADGRMLDTAAYTLPPRYEAIRKGLGFFRELPRASGAVELKVVLFDRGSGKSGSVIVPLR